MCRAATFGWRARQLGVAAGAAFGLTAALLKGMTDTYVIRSSAAGGWWMTTRAAGWQLVTAMSSRVQATSMNRSPARSAWDVAGPVGGQRGQRGTQHTLDGQALRRH